MHSMAHQVVYLREISVNLSRGWGIKKQLHAWSVVSKTNLSSGELDVEQAKQAQTDALARISYHHV